MSKIGVRLAIVACVLSWSAGQATAEKGRPLVIDGSYFRKLPRLDQGTSHLFLRNASDEPVLIRQVLVDEKPLPKQALFGLELEDILSGLKPSPPKQQEKVDERVLWYQVHPNPIPPGKVGEITVRWATKPPAPVRLGIRTVDGGAYSVVHALEAYPFRMTAVRFSEGLNRVYVYALNDGKESVTPRWISLDSLDVSASVYPPLTGEKLHFRQKRCYVVPLTEPLRRGQYITMKIGTEEGVVAESMVRVFSGFPIIAEEDAGYDFLDKDTRAVSPGAEKAGPKDFLCALSCPTHAHGTFQEAGQILVQTMARLRTTFPETPAYVFICKLRQEEGLYAFGEAADSVVTNPAQPLHMDPQKPLKNVSQLVCRIAHDAASPRPAMMVLRNGWDERIPAFKDRPITVDEMRMYAYFGLSQGMQGILYGLRSKPSEIELRALEQLTSEIKAVRGYLSSGEPMALGRTNQRFVEASTIQAGYEGMVILVVNHDVTSRPAGQEPVFESVPKDGIGVSLEIPDHFGRLRGLKEISAQGEMIPTEFRQGSGKISFEVPSIELTRLYLLEAAKPY